MLQCAMPRTGAVPLARPLPAVPPALAVGFDAGRLTGDGGLPWVAAAEAARGLCAAFAAGIPAWRRGPVQHSLEPLVRRRVFPIACGAADQDDADGRRRDPRLQAVCGRPPRPGPIWPARPPCPASSTLSTAAPVPAWPMPGSPATGASVGAPARRGACSWPSTAPPTPPTGPGRAPPLTR